METSTWQLISSTQYALPVVVVVVLVVVVFALGFRSSVEPPTLAYLEPEKKPAPKKSKKQKPSKDAKEEVKERSERSPETKKTEKKQEKAAKKQVEAPVEKKQEKAAEKKEQKTPNNKTKESNKKNVAPAPKLAEEIKNKKNERNLKKLHQTDDKPVDFDDGNWVQVLSGKDKKVKQTKQEEEFAAKIKKNALKEAKRIAAEKVAKAKKDAENAQQLAKQAQQQQKKQEKEIKVIQQEEEPEEREISKKRNRKGSNSKKVESEPVTFEVVKQPGPLASANNKKASAEDAPAAAPGVAFDEVGDWQENKPKKSKKKTRKD